MRHSPSVILSCILLASCATAPVEQGGMSRASSVGSQSSASSESSSVSSAGIRTINVGIWKNGTFREVASFKYPTERTWENRGPEATYGLNDKIYVIVGKTVIEYDPASKTRTEVYRNPGATAIVGLKASPTEHKVYVTESFRKPSDPEMLFTQALMEINTETKAIRKVDEMQSAPYTSLRFVSNSRRAGDVIYCFCGGEGGGSWQHYMLLTPDGQRETIQNVSGSMGDDEVKRIDGYAYDQDALVMRKTKYSKEMAESSEFYLYKIYLQEEVPTPIRAEAGLFLMSADQSMLAAFSEKQHVIYSFPDGEIIRSRTVKDNAFYWPEGFLSMAKKTFWKTDYQQASFLINYDGAKPVIAPIGGDGYYVVEKILGRDDEVLLVKDSR